MRSIASHRSAFGLFAAVLALFGQIILSPARPAQAAFSDAILFGDVPICHSGTPDNSGSEAPAKQGQHEAQCALCPVCHALAAAALLPVPALQPLAPPTALIARLAPLPPARAPPADAVLAAIYPTGPPSLA